MFSPAGDAIKSASSSATDYSIPQLADQMAVNVQQAGRQFLLDTEGCLEALRETPTHQVDATRDAAGSRLKRYSNNGADVNVVTASDRQSVLLNL